MGSFLVFELVVFLVYVGYLLREYAVRRIAWHIKLLVYASWLICFSFILILPIDVFNVTQASDVHNDSFLLARVPTRYLSLHKRSESAPSLFFRAFSRPIHKFTVIVVKNPGHDLSF